MFTEFEGPTDQIAVSTAFRDHRIGRKQFHEILVERTEEVERKISRLRWLRLEQESKSGCARTYVLEGLLAEGSVHQAASGDRRAAGSRARRSRRARS